MRPSPPRNEIAKTRDDGLWLIALIWILILAGPPERKTQPVADHPEPRRAELVVDQVVEPVVQELVAERPVDHRRAVVRIVVDSGPSVSRGSGVLVEHDGRPVVLTAFHVVRSAPGRIVCHFQDGSSTRARLLGSSDAWDLAALDVGTPAIPPASMSSETFELGDELTVTGYGPHPSSFRQASGKVVGRSAPTSEHPTDFLTIDAEARDGDSGGPVFDRRGKVAGILWGCRDGQTRASEARRVLRFLDEVDTASQSSRTSTGSSCPDGRCLKR